MIYLPFSNWNELSIFYTYLTQHIVPGPHSSCYFIPFLLLPLALLIPPWTLSHDALATLFLPIIYGCQIHAWILHGIDVISINLTLWSFVLLVWKDPRVTFRRVKVLNQQSAGKDKGELAKNVKEELFPINLGRRLKWVLTVLVSLRFTGWKIGDPSHDRNQPSSRISRIEFLKGQSMAVLGCYLSADAASCYAHTDPYFTTSEMSIDTPYPPLEAKTSATLIILKFLPPRVLRSTVLAAHIYGLVKGAFLLPTLPAVGLNALGLLSDDWSPQSWPAFFGDFRAISDRGLRGLWGSWWHGFNRYVTAAHGRGVADYLELSPKSWLRYALLVISAFFFSGAMHMGMIPPQPKSTSYSANMMRLHIAGFFWVQILGFGVELTISRLVERFAPTIVNWRTTKAVVLLWVAAWLSLVLHLLTVPFREIGYWQYHAVPISVFRGLAGTGWTSWSSC